MCVDYLHSLGEFESEPLDIIIQTYISYEKRFGYSNLLSIFGVMCTICAMALQIYDGYPAWLESQDILSRI